MGGIILSLWSYINGTVTVSPMGRTQVEKRYILDTVLEHLPVVTGSEGDMDVYVLQKRGYNKWSNCDEFGQFTNNLIDDYGDRSRERGWLRIQDEYILVVNGALRDRMFDQAYREFLKWLCRLAKRVDVSDVLVEVKGCNQSAFKSALIRNDELDSEKSCKTTYGQMFEYPTWNNKDGEVNWCEYLLWNREKYSSYPMMLTYKYFEDKENDEEVERRMKYERSN